MTLAGRLAPREIFTTEIAAAGPSEGGAKAVAVQADGKAVVAGTSRCIGQPLRVRVHRPL